MPNSGTRAQGHAPALPGNDAANSAVPAIEFRGVMKKFGSNVVLRGLDFAVGKGERVTLIGPSGSGKTTILRLAMTLEEADDGLIYVDGEPYTHEICGNRRVALGEKRRRLLRKRVGMVFQQFNLFPNLSVLENLIEAPTHVLGLTKEHAVTRARELLDQVGLADKVDARCTELSGGQQQRVAIARALAMNPEILLLDEVTSALDPELVADVLAVLRDVAKTTDITMLIVTHEMQFARDVSDRVLMFDGGRVIEEAPPGHMFTTPRHERTREFLKAVLGTDAAESTR